MNYVSPSASLLLACLFVSSCENRKPVADTSTNPAASVWQSDTYRIFRDRVEQGDYVAKAVSPTELTSNYHSPANAFQSPKVSFKFSLNGKDNEMPSGQNHVVVALPKAGGAAIETPLIVFGQHYEDQTPIPANTYLAPNTQLKLRLDLRLVLAAFKQQGFYTTAKGDKIYQQDFKHVYVAGDAAPLSWDFDDLVNKPELELKDPDGDGIYEVTLTLNQPQAAKTTATQWKQSINTTDFPQYTSEYPLADALYNLALEEARRAVEPDSTFRTGKEWAGVWTRDISYSIILAQASLQPKVAMNSLMRKVSPEGRIIQDTGTGGAYPCSTDRMIWATAAWEIYKVTGDQAWLRQVYPIIQKSIEDDVQNAYDQQTGLVRGESSFLDWREQTYPRWMQPVDIYESENLGTNAVHYHANVVLAEMAQQLGDQAVATKHQQLAEQIKKGVNQHLWQAGKGYYGQFLYGRTNLILSPRAEALGEGLSVLFGLAEGERAQQVVAKTPLTAYGISCIYPQIPGIPPYHNNAVWPFVQSFWALAAAKAGNEASVTESMAAIYRPAALFLTNKENYVAENGDFAGTQINSSNMLWSLSGSLSLVYKVLFGMQFQPDRLVFRPFVPRAFQGQRKLTNFHYRGAVLDMELQGFGNELATITLDGQPLPGAAVPATLTGRYTVRMVLRDKVPQQTAVTRVPNRFSPETPAVTFANNRLTWTKQEGVKTYKVLKDGQPLTSTASSELAISAASFAVYQVIAVDNLGLESFASEPLPVGTQAAGQQYQLETLAPKAALPYKGFSGSGFVEISKTKNRTLTIPVTVAEAGLYAVDFRYANGNGPTNTNNKCAIRTLRSGENQLGTIVLPQRGVDEWSNWGFTNAVLVRLEKGTHPLTLAFEPANENMNGDVNQAMLDYLRVRRVQ
ncbi:MGH1-like glycoside hydrolase domain-containing protein [Hymenobacter sp. GOD-10R]|uniref:alpha-L-rhamnosidase-related protein n=1 Tax=Hymenobacter sp. GOD-10R TaxID=3093922 RepID=UPI002D76F555|nr:glycogen debranching protein [Hymenobacter sp. GOD-10R]WRQ27046.1 glycogen debranching protein [Hymenobacter sp. GOD-10R]